MYLMKIAGVFFIAISCFGVFSCGSNSRNENNLIDYSENSDPEMVSYRIEIVIQNRNVLLLKQNIFNEILQNKGTIKYENTQNKNRYDLGVDIPKTNYSNFIKNIKAFGIIVNESKSSTDMGDRYDGFKNRLTTYMNMVEKYNELLKEANTIADKLLLEKELFLINDGIKDCEITLKEMETQSKYHFISITMYK